VVRKKKSQTDETDASDGAGEGETRPAAEEQGTPETERTPVAEDASRHDTVEDVEDKAEDRPTDGSLTNEATPDEPATDRYPDDRPDPGNAQTPEDATGGHASHDDVSQNKPESMQVEGDASGPDIAGPDIAGPPEDTRAPAMPSGAAAPHASETGARGNDTFGTEASVAEAETTQDEGTGRDTETAPSSDEPAPEPAQDAAPVVRTEQVTVRKGGFWSMLTGGIVAAGIGVAAAPYIVPYLEPYLPADMTAATPDDGLAARLDEQAQRITDLGERLDGLPAPSDPGDAIAGLRNEVSGLNDTVTELTGRVGDIESQVSTLEDRVATLADRPAPELPEMPDTDPINAAIDELRDRLAAQRTEIEDLNATLQAEEEAARDSARATLQRAALTRVMTALDTGGEFSAALSDLRETGAQVPGALADMAETGVPTRAQLVDSFPGAARAALEAVYTADADGAASVGAFLRAQLGVRSLEPREGDDPDAILSRAEAALEEGRLDNALAEIETLPEEARSAMSDWTSRAKARNDALAAAEALSAGMN